MAWSDLNKTYRLQNYAGPRIRDTVYGIFFNSLLNGNSHKLMLSKLSNKNKLMASMLIPKFGTYATFENLTVCFLRRLIFLQMHITKKVLSLLLDDNSQTDIRTLWLAPHLNVKLTLFVSCNMIFRIQGQINGILKIN